MRKNMLEEIVHDLENLAVVLGEAEEKEKPEFEKEISEDTVMYDCDASDCTFWNEGFRGNCRLASIEIDAKHGCMQYRFKGKENES